GRRGPGRGGSRTGSGRAGSRRPAAGRHTAKRDRSSPPGVLPPDGIVSRRPLGAAGIAVIAPGPVAPDAPADVRAPVARVLAQLAAEDAELAPRVVEGAMVARLAGPEGQAQVLRRTSRESRPAAADRGGDVGVAVAQLREAVALRELD